MTLETSKVGTIKIVKNNKGIPLLGIPIKETVSKSKVINRIPKIPKIKPIVREPVSPIKIFFFVEKLNLKNANSMLINATQIPV